MWRRQAKFLLASASFTALTGCSGAILGSPSSDACQQRDTLFAAEIAPVLEGPCIACHVAGGLAATSGLALVAGDTSGNLAAFSAVAAETQDGKSLVLLKPSAQIPHTGGALVPVDSATYASFQKFVTLNVPCLVAPKDTTVAPKDSDSADAGVDPSGSGSGTNPGAAGSGTNPGTGSGTNTATPEILPLRVRRLTNAEIDTSAMALLGTSLHLSNGAPNDVRQGYFARNDGAAIDSVVASVLGTGAKDIATEASSMRLSTLAPCKAAAGAAQDTCAKDFIASFALKAFRRPLTADDTNGLLAVYHVGFANPKSGSAAYASGIELVIETVLQSADFLYVDETGGDACASGNTHLTAVQLASSLSYFLTGAPPDDALTKSAASGALLSSDEIKAQTTRLLATPAGSQQLAVFVAQWLGLDAVAPGPLHDSMLTETKLFVADAYRNGGDLAELLTAQSSFIDAPLASLYGLPAPAGSTMTKTNLGGTRKGLLNQAAFLSVNTHQSKSSPTKRGHVVRSRMLCQSIPPPDPSLMVNMTLPPPVQAQTTRQVYEAHTQRATCASCHKLMDSIGFAFENFDEKGAYRTKENGTNIDDSGEINGIADVQGAFADGSALLDKLAKSSSVAACYAESFFRYAAARSSDGLDAAFSNFLAAQPPQSSLPALISALVQSDLFTQRRCSQ